MWDYSELTLLLFVSGINKPLYFTINCQEYLIAMWMEETGMKATGVHIPHSWTLKRFCWNSLLLAPLYQVCFCTSYHNSSLVIFPLPHITDIFYFLSIAASTWTSIGHPEDGAVRSSERSEKYGHIFINVLYFLYWERVSHFSNTTIREMI